MQAKTIFPYKDYIPVRRRAYRPYDARMEKQSLHKVWWLYIPLIALAVQGALEMMLSVPVLARMHTEGGPHEILQFLTISAACVAAFLALFDPSVRPHRWIRAWFALAALCSFYVAGEEMSWGQHILRWSTPEYWAAINDQNETNLHNASAWLDQKPRILLEIGVITGGVLIPVLQKFKASWLPVRFAAIYPPSILGVTAGVFLALKIADAIADAAHVRLFERVSEVQELYLFYFVLLYMVALRRRLS